jgi:hypothetical protein
MACPFFEPSDLVKAPRRPGVRLPLLDEYEGLCHASGTVAEPAPTMLATACNQGYARACPNHPLADRPSAMRYSVTAQTEQELIVLWIEEQAYEPVRRGTVCFDVRSGVAAPVPPPAISAQVTAFCRSYLARCAQQKVSTQEHNDN